jgi:hypothetical protein
VAVADEPGQALQIPGDAQADRTLVAGFGEHAVGQRALGDGSGADGVDQQVTAHVIPVGQVLGQLHHGLDDPVRGLAEVRAPEADAILGAQQARREQQREGHGQRRRHPAEVMLSTAHQLQPQPPPT